MKKSNKVSLVMAALLLTALFLAPLIVNSLFSLEAPCDFMKAKFTAGDLLGYIGSALVGVGSIVLGIFAFLQTDRIDKVERDMWERQDRFKEENTKRPFFVVDSVLIDGVPIEANEDGRYKADGVVAESVLSVLIKNIGDGPACQFRMRETLGFGKPSPMEEHRLCIPKGACFEYTTSINKIEKTGEAVTTFKYENIIGYLYSQRIDVGVLSVAVYSPDQEEIEDGVFVDVALDESRRLMVSSLTAQSVEDREIG